MRILVAVDPDDAAFGAILDVTARLRRADDEVRIVHVYPAPIQWYSDPAETPESATHADRVRLADELEQRLRERGLEGASPSVGVGRSTNVGNDIVDLATDFDAELVVLGTHGRTLRRGLFVGSVAERVVRLAPCDVYVVRAPVLEAR